MLNRGRVHKLKLIRFRRWSRKNFAIFAGLKANVVIGRLSNDIVDRLLPKTTTLASSVRVNTTLNCEVSSTDDILSKGGALATMELLALGCASYNALSLQTVQVTAINVMGGLLCYK